MPLGTNIEGKPRSATARERQQLQQYLLRKWRNNHSRTVRNKERDARRLVSMARILVTEWDDDGQFEYTNKITVIWDKGLGGLQWFTATGNGPLKLVCTSGYPAPDQHSV